MPLAPGTHLGTYEIVAPLGSGGMGEVYRARDLRLRRNVALKILPEALARDADHLARFEREARIVAGLNHPNIVTLFSVEDDENIRFLTMELIEGQSVAELIRPGGLTLRHALEIAIAIADALAFAHERGVVHRDLKPANVMLATDDRVKVLDFGLAWVAPAAASVITREMTMSGVRSDSDVIAGTVPYMAPEQIRGGAIDARTDLFAFGVLMYELLSGRRPFAAPTALATSAAILNDEPRPLAMLRADLPPDIERLVQRCLEKAPRDRIQTSLDVGHELRRLRRALDQAETGPQSAHRVPSIAVLPFVNRSRDEADEYFSDGLADELINMLAKIPGLRVAARSSAFTFKGKQVPVSQVGDALKVATVLEGSVRKAGNRARISVQLVKVADGYHLWSETYDRTLEDIFAVQDDIAQSVVKELRGALLGEADDSDASERARAEVAQAVRGRATNPEAHRLHLLARHLLGRFTPGDTARAIEYLRQGLELDPGAADVWAELGGAYSRSASWRWGPLAEGFRLARKAVERALELEPRLGDAYAQLAGIQIGDGFDRQGARVSLARALELVPESPLALRTAAQLARYEGRMEDALTYVRRSLEHDPLNAASYHILGWVHYASDRFVDAEQSFLRAQELAPQRAVTRAFLALTLLAQGLGDQARAIAAQETASVHRLWSSAIVLRAMGEQAGADAALRELTEGHAAEAACQIADLHAAQGELDAAFHWLERAYAHRAPDLNDVKSSPRYRPLHTDPRWVAFTRKIGFDR